MGGQYIQYSLKVFNECQKFENHWYKMNIFIEFVPNIHIIFQIPFNKEFIPSKWVHGSSLLTCSFMYFDLSHGLLLFSTLFSLESVCVCDSTTVTYCDFIINATVVKEKFTSFFT